MQVVPNEAFMLAAGAVHELHIGNYSAMVNLCVVSYQITKQSSVNLFFACLFHKISIVINEGHKVYFRKAPFFSQGYYFMFI